MKYLGLIVLSVIILIIAVTLCMSFKDVGYYDDMSEANEALRNGQYKVADKLFNDLALRYPDKYAVFYNRGIALGFLGISGDADAMSYYRKACVQFEKAANLNSSVNSVFYSWGNVYARMAEIDPNDATNFSHACEKFQKATEINPNDDLSYYSWGAVLLNQDPLEESNDRDRYLTACDKFQKAISIKPDMYQAFDGWGIALICLAKIEKEEKALILKQAETTLLKSEAIRKGYSAYNLACVYALLGDEDQCKYWLKLGEEAKTLQSRDYAMKSESLASMRDKDWFKAIRWKGE